MSRKGNRKRRQDRRARKAAFEAFEEHFPSVGLSPNLLALNMMAKDGATYKARQKARDINNPLDFDNFLMKKKGKLRVAFKSQWREGVASLGERGWERRED